MFCVVVFFLGCVFQGLLSSLSSRFLFKGFVCEGYCKGTLQGCV